MVVVWDAGTVVLLDRAHRAIKGNVDGNIQGVENGAMQKLRLKPARCACSGFIVTLVGASMSSVGGSRCSLSG
jgi:hypothetical protein